MIAVRRRRGSANLVRIASTVRSHSADQNLLSIKDASKALGISYSTLYQMTAQGDIEWVMIGSRKYIARESLMDFIKTNTHKGYYVAR